MHTANPPPETSLLKRCGCRTRDGGVRLESLLNGRQPLPWAFPKWPKGTHFPSGVGFRNRSFLTRQDGVQGVSF